MFQRIALFLMSLLLVAVIIPATAFGNAASPAGSLPVLAIGMPDQPVGDVTIAENAPGTLGATATYSTTTGNGMAASDATNSAAVLRLLLPPGVIFASTPTVSVTSGDIQVGALSCNQLDGNQGYLDIRINSSSTTPSVIKVSGIRLTLDRTVPDGQITLQIQGTAVDQTMLPPSGLFADLGQESSLFSSPDNAAVVPLAIVAASGTQQTGTAVFRIGVPNYTFNGTEETLDVSPYIKDGRIMVPLRAVADAAGIPDSSIIWDQSGNIILTRGGLMASLTVGSRTLLVNGAGIAMDVAPEIVMGRTMAPISWISQALGLSVQWNAGTQTVTIT
jgi:hypothetical protein